MQRASDLSDFSEMTPMLESSRSLSSEHEAFLRSPPLGSARPPLQKVHEEVAAAVVAVGSLDSVEDAMLQTTDTDLDDDVYRKSPSAPPRDAKANDADADLVARRGFVRIYFENPNFTSSTVLRVEEHTSVLEVRQIMANKMRLSSKQLDHHAILMVYVNNKGSSMSARTLKDDEFIFQVQEAIHSERQSLPEITNESNGPVRAKPRHRARQTLKFVFKDIRGKPIDLEAELEPKPASNKRSNSTQDTVFLLPQKLGTGLRSGALKKASLKDSNVWRSRWFVLKEDKLYYCKSESNQRDITAIPLLNSMIVKQDALVPHCFELHTSRRIYRFCAESDDAMMAWIHALHREIRLSAENQVLTKAEIFIIDEAVTTCERNQERTPYAVAGILGSPPLRKMFRDFMVTESVATAILVDTYVECEQFRQNGLVRFQAQRQQQSMASAQDEWDHVKRLLLQYIPAAQKAGAKFHEADVDLCRQSLHDNQKHRRLSIAMDQEVNNLVTDFPSPNLFVTIQQDILRALEEGPFQRFIAGKGYTRIIDRTIRR
ncbi:Aste57867_2127 [Aphanomyces stellatus]|uniref:Aste57867_2127 protein n=1 Tax=Aphanomyces stellatus TaxID=120398 RepID=A0A485KB58_9STRA|nr:hypothetical protein As57867_002122 [Aphanomyces stellatus]VFT79330.1 Aste57867_2127 [Aphanomyces stellatus]